jgi:hypothetical protein
LITSAGPRQVTAAWYARDRARRLGSTGCSNHRIVAGEPGSFNEERL